MKPLFPLLALFALALSAVAETPAFDALRPPVLLVRPEADKPSRPLAPVAARVRVDVRGSMARTELDLTFGNDLDRVLEGQLVLALPPEATVTAFALETEGTLREASVVEREKARFVFESEVRRNVDPGLVEWVQGNVFQTRVYPIPAHGTKRCVIAWEWEVSESFLVPLRLGRLKDFVLEVTASGVVPEVSGIAGGKRAALPEDLDVVADVKAQTFRASAEGKDMEVAWDLVLTLPPVDKPRVAVESTKEGRTFSAVMSVAETSGIESKPGRVALFWDASASRTGTQAERDLLAAWFGWLGGAQVHLVVFSNAVWFEEDFTVADGKAEALLARLAGLVPDGGSRFAGLDFSAFDGRADAIVLCTDGMTTFGTALPVPGSRPVHVICSQATSDRAMLDRLATGHRFDLTTEKVEACLAAWKTEPAIFLGVEGAGVSDVLPPAPCRADRVLAIAGRVTGNAPVEARARFRDASGKTWEVPFTIGAGVEGARADRTWARKKVASLVPAAAHEEEVLQLGLRYGIVTPRTSLLVLETLDQYVRYRVLPPKEMQDAYFERIEKEKVAAAKTRGEKLTYVRGLWTARVEWWKQDFKVPPGFKYDNPEEKNPAEDGAEPESGEERGAPPGDPREPLREDAQRVRRGAEGGIPAKKDKADGPSEPGITLKPWSPDTPYLKALRSAGDGAYAAYGKLRAEYGNSSAFFLDCADFFLEERKDLKTALQILSNVAEMDLGSPQLLRILGHRLDQMKEAALAAEVFRNVLRLRPEEPQSYRDLALVLAKCGEYAEAIALLEKVVLGTWDGRFPELEVLALGELNEIAEACRAKTGKEHHTLPADLIASLPCDLRVTLTWDADACDMDLWVVEPSGEKAFYSHRATTSGGRFGCDFTQGYGPEEYLVKKAMPGKFQVKINYYGNSQQVLAGATTVQIRIYKNYGRPDEEKIEVTRRLKDAKEVLDLAEVSFE
ncbi:MAG: DUF2135 domain-containing protein [Planctomycetes bacterium]|nr:DUF2135 domain-containing protein [Planctomycetota bacterium]